MEKNHTEATTLNNNNLETVYCSTPTSSRNKERSHSLLKTSMCSSPILKSTAGFPSSSSSICSMINNVFNPSSSSLTGSTTLMKNPDASMSPSFENHLFFPKPSPAAQTKTKIKAPSAISGVVWRDHIQTKENEKIAKAEAVKERKLERQKRKVEGECKQTKPKKGKQKQICSACDEELDTDAEDDDQKNVGCDTCPQWYHLKCTEFKNLKYHDIISKDFVCQACKEKNV